MATVVPGFYDDGQGRMRFYDGSQWTDEYQDPTAAAPPVVRDPNVLWEAVGKPLTGIGAGRYKLTREFLFFEKGALSTRAQQIPIHEVHDVDAGQTMTQKARGVGTITLNVQRSTGPERVVLEDVTDFRGGVSQINAAATAARDALRTKQQTQHVNYAGAMPGMGHSPAQQAPAQAAPGSDLNAELAKLAAYRDSGVLDAEEFTAAKRKLLGL